ncbi:MAG TPA: hypothetical protein VEJ67_04690 [Candidatus Cybelea sp.]|nr:hypothetical protein [Candidatus Cybelea sp.]
MRKIRIIRRIARRPQGEPTSARDALILMVAVIAVAAYAIFFGLQTLVWLETHRWAHADPWLRDMPQAVTDAPAQPGATELKAFDFEFKVPWSGKQKAVSAPDRVEFRFDSGPVVILFDPEAQVDLLRTITSEEPTQYNQFHNIFLNQSFASNYDLYSAVYSARPAAVSPWVPLRDAVRINQLLLWKLAFGLPAAPGIHAITFGANRGFEFGDPSSGRPVALQIFNGRDAQFRFLFLVAAGSGAKISQEEINSVVASLEPVPIAER